MNQLCSSLCTSRFWFYKLYEVSVGSEQRKNVKKKWRFVGQYAQLKLGFNLHLREQLIVWNRVIAGKIYLTKEYYRRIAHGLDGYSRINIAFQSSRL